MFFVLEVPNRSGHLLGTITNPEGRWTTQQIRDLVLDLGERATQFRVLVRDRAGQFTASFDALLADVASRWSGSCSVPASELLRRTVRAHSQSRTHRPHVDLRSVSTYGQCSPNMSATTTADDPTAPATCAHHGRPTPPRISTINTSRVDRSG